MYDRSKKCVGPSGQSEPSFERPAPFSVCRYVGKEVVQKNIPMEQAVDALVQLIKDNGRWIDPPVSDEPALAK